MPTNDVLLPQRVILYQLKSSRGATKQGQLLSPNTVSISIPKFVRNSGALIREISNYTMHLCETIIWTIISTFWVVQCTVI